MRLRSASLLLLSSMLVAVQARAQDAQPYHLGTILFSLGGRFAEAADRGTSVYVTEQELDRARTGNLRDLFAGIASVSVGGAIPVAQKIFVNGVDMLNLGVTIDGVAQNNRAFHHVSANAIDPGLLQAVRADAGVAGADAGPHALAGSVVFETVDPADVLDGRAFGGMSQLGYHSNGDAFTASTTLAADAGALDLLAYLRRATGGDYAQGGGGTVAGTAPDLLSWLLKGVLDLPEGHRIELSGQRLVDDALRPWRANFGGIEGAPPTQQLRRYATTRDSLSLSYTNTQPTAFWDPEFTLGYSQSLIDVPEPWGSEGTSTALSFTLENTFRLGAGTITAGIDGYDRLGRYEGPAELYDESARNLGVFAQARLEPAEALDLSFGLRHDWQEFTGIDGTVIDSAGTSANLSAAYDITGNLTLRAGWSTVFGGIVIEDNYTFSPRWTYEALRAARSENTVLGLDWRSETLTLGAELFDTAVSDARAATGTFDFESRGFNLTAGTAWGTGFARFSWSHSQVEVDGAPASSYAALDFGAPLGDVIAIEVEQMLPGDEYTIGGRIDVALDYDEVGEDSYNSIPGYEVLDLWAEYTPQALPGLTLRAEVTNVFDTLYADRATYGADYDGEVITLKEQGRSIGLVASIDF